MATDLTGAGAEITLVPDASGNFTLTVGDTVSLLAYPMCLKITQAQRIRVAGTGTAGSPILVGGTYDSIGDVGVYSKQSPLQPDCYDNVNAVIPACRTGGTWPCGQNMEPAATAAMYCVAPNQKAFEPAAILPFFNLLVKSNNGAVYVLP